jgi:hypothetical protein
MPPWEIVTAPAGDSKYSELSPFETVLPLTTVLPPTVTVYVPGAKPEINHCAVPLKAGVKVVRVD